MKQKIIVISGSGGMGKSTFVSLCNQFNDKVVEVSTVDEVKRIGIKCGWDGTKTERNRAFLSDLKDLLEKWNNVPNKKIDEYIENHPEEIIFINAREPHNIQYYKDKYNAITVLVVNDHVKQVTSNHADLGVYDFAYDYIIENNGDLEQLKESAETFMEIMNRIANSWITKCGSKFSNSSPLVNIENVKFYVNSTIKD